MSTAMTSFKKNGTDQSASPTVEDYANGEDSPRKKRKLSPGSGQLPDNTTSKKGRACIACRKLKVKCDSIERGSLGCSRCQRLGLECLNAKKLRVSLEGENDQPHPALVRLDRAVEDILHKLKMPNLNSYSKPLSEEPSEPMKPASEFLTTRENSKEPPDVEQDIAPAPMGSLYEVTQLNSLRSKLRQANPAKRSSRRNIEADLISQKLIDLDDAEELLELYKKSLARYLFATTMADDTTLQAVRESSTLLLTAVMLVSALHIPGKEAIHTICHKHFLELVATSMFERYHTLDDIRALCIAAFWQPDLSWKLSGLCVRMATELNLHHAFYSAFYSQNITEDQRKHALEKARVWYLLYVLDHHFSIAYGRPPVTAELLPVKEYDVFINSPWCTYSDRRLISQVSIFVTLSKAFEVFGLEPERLMGSDETSLLCHLRFSEDIRAWKDRWKDLVLPDKYVADYPSKGVYVHYHFSSLVLNSLALRGRPLDSTLGTSLPQPLRPIALHAIESAHSILSFFMEEPSYRDSLVGIPLYLHSMIAFAVVFLIRMAHCWHLIGVSIDPESFTRPLIEGVIEVLKNCKAGNGHMVFSMATGFERMLKRRWGKLHEQAHTSREYRSDRNGQLNTKHTADTTTSNAQIGTRGGSHHVLHHMDSITASPYDRPMDQNIRNNINTDISPPGFYQQQQTVHNVHQNQQALLSPGSRPDTSSYAGDYQTASGVSGGNIGGYSGYSLGLDFQDDMLWSAGMGYDLLHTNTRPDLGGGFGLGMGSLPDGRG